MHPGSDKTNTYFHLELSWITAAVSFGGSQISQDAYTDVQHVTHLHKTLIQHKVSSQGPCRPSPSFPLSTLRSSLGKMHARSIYAQHQRCHGNSPPFLFPPQLPSTALDSVPRPPLYRLNILSMFRQICWKTLFTFFPQHHSFLSGPSISHGSTYILDLDSFPFSPP